MSTRRERLEAKAEKRAEWAQGRLDKAAGLLARNEKFHGDITFFTQPGRIIERERFYDRSERAGKHQAMARHHEEKADGLADQLERTIFSDDDNAAEALRARIAEHEAARERLAAYNASCRKALKTGGAGDQSLLSEDQRAELATLLRVCAYQVRPGGAFPAYASSNLGGRIKADRERLAEIERRTEQEKKAEAAGGVLITRHGEGVWCSVRFAEKPERAVIAALRNAFFRFSRGAWVGKADSIPAEVLELVEPGGDR